jgi:hypothetical protein
MLLHAEIAMMTVEARSAVMASAKVELTRSVSAKDWLRGAALLSVVCVRGRT